jgi:hypothetical protein
VIEAAPAPSAPQVPTTSVVAVALPVPMSSVPAVAVAVPVSVVVVAVGSTMPPPRGPVVDVARA